MQDQKPKAKAKKRGYKANPAGNYNPSKVVFKACKSDIEYIRKINSTIQYGLALIIRAELYKRGLTYRGLWNLCQEAGYSYQLATITALCNGANNRWNMAGLYKLAYVLELDLHPLQIADAITYLRANGRSVKEF